ncbi:MAG TPA: hypothetical protein VN578_18320 [Candidatus Binatia bacterium]|nr:hypothetical protein [Candidatus Binatia bacterium]
MSSTTRFVAVAAFATTSLLTSSVQADLQDSDFPQYSPQPNQ